MRTRREFLLDGAALALTAGLAPSALTASTIPGRGAGLPRINFANFARHQGTNFRVLQTNRAAVALKLVEATSWSQSFPHVPGVEDERNEKFTLLFRGALGQPLEQDTYLFEHPGIGQFAMFIVLIGSTDSGHLYYEAVFNRPMEGSVMPERRRAGQTRNVFAQ